MPIALDVDDDQRLFHETTVRFIETELPRERTRELHDDPVGFESAWLSASAELGWYSMLVPEEHGGGSVSGASMADAALVAEELGRHVQPGPFVPMNVALAAVAAHGSDRLREEVVPPGVAGHQVLTWAPLDDRGRWDLGAGLSLSRDEGGFVLVG